MKVKVIDESHEKDLEESINKFLILGNEIIDIKYSVACTAVGEDQIYCFTAMILYKDLSD